MPTQLPVRVLADPHWRVNLQPTAYKAELIPTLGECFGIVEQTKVRLRGWDYPHLSHSSEERGQGANWVASWSDFMGHREYWRLYQSGQFLHLFSVREAVDPGWREKLEAETRRHLRSCQDIKWDRISGYIDIVNFLYTVTEIFEFAARLCQRDLYRGEVRIDIRLNGIAGFVLTTDLNRAWYNYYAASEDQLGRFWTVPSNLLIADSADLALKAVAWFFERFGWLDLALDTFKQDQSVFLRGRR
jgi:hypothetical protein